MAPYEALSPQSRVWIYQSSRPFAPSEIPQIRQLLDQFATQWVSHNRQLKSHADLFHDRFIVLMVDETQAGASGCSIDASVHFLRQLAELFGVDLFDRLTFAYKRGDSVETAGQDEFIHKVKSGEIPENTLVFDNLVATKDLFEKSWLKPLEQSWHMRLVR